MKRREFITLLEYRWAEGRSERFAEIAAEFVRLKVDVIFTTGSAVFAVKQTTSAIPAVFTLAQDPLGTGLVASLARPGGNVNGTKLHPMQSAFMARHALQCGFCTPGFLMLAVNVLERNPDITDEEILHVLSSNLCRCTGYQNIVKAVRSAASENRAAAR
jgi:hypothetical protein